MAKFFSVGVGAGDGEYITLGALRVLEKADIIAVPVKKHGKKSTALEILEKEFNINRKKVLELEFPMSRDRAVKAKSHKAAAEKIIAELENNKTVAMITLGDVSVYSTGAYVNKEIQNAGYETEIIAGVPSFIAAADKARISLCEGDETVAVIPSVNAEKIENYIDDFDTLIIMKAGKNIDALYGLLKKYNLENNAIICSNIGMENEIIGKIDPDKTYGYFTTVIIKKKL